MFYIFQVKRTSSFAALRPKRNGLVALARDIEKKFRKKRRSKTADFSELLRVNVPQEEIENEVENEQESNYDSLKKETLSKTIEKEEPDESF